MSCRAEPRISELTITVILLSLNLTTPASSAPAWEDSPPLAPAVKRAAQQKRTLLLKVGTAWCPSCQALERVLADAAVARATASYLRLSYDAEEGEGRDVAQRFNVVAFPTLLVVGGDGREIGRVTGDLPGPRLVAALKKIEAGTGRPERLEQTLTRHPSDLALRLEVGTAFALRGIRSRASAHLDQVVAEDKDNQAGLAAEALLVKGKYLLLRSLQDHRGAEEVLRQLRARFPRSRQARAAVYPLAQALHGQQRTLVALQLLEGSARSAEDHDQVAWFCLRHRAALDRGIAHARRATTLAPKQAEPWAHLGALREARGQHGASLEAWSRALALDPGNTRYRLQRDLQQSRVRETR